MINKRSKSKSEASMTFLSVNINKVATLRNSRGKNTPDLIDMTQRILHLGVKGITIHPRPDQRHIRKRDVYQLKEFLTNHPDVEFNIEGYPSDDFLSLVEQINPTQCTLVPDPPGTLTSNAGWNLIDCKNQLQPVIQRLKDKSIRSALFIDPNEFSTEQFEALKTIQPDRIELYTESYADSFGLESNKQVINTYAACAQQVHQAGIKINAGHDLNQENLPLFLKSLPEVSEVSIGHAIFCECLLDGLSKTIETYLSICSK